LAFFGAGADSLIAGNLPTTLRIPLNVENQITFGLGLEYFINDVFGVAVGYHFNDNAMHENYLNQYCPTETEHTFSLGFSARPSKNIKVGFAYAYSILADPEASDYHGYDQSLEEQLQMPKGSLDSEFNGAKGENAAHFLEFSLSFFW